MIRPSLWIAIALLFSSASNLLPDDENFIVADPVLQDPDVLLSDEYQNCPKLQSGVEPLDYRTLKIQLGSLRDTLGAILPNERTAVDEPDRTIDVTVYGRQLIESEGAYREIFGEPAPGIDWESSRILVVEQFTSYKFGELDSTIGLSGIYLLDDAIIVSETGNHYGPCQGIAQDPAWFSFDISYQLVVLPRLPERIEYHFCSMGGCPPDIP